MSLVSLLLAPPVAVIGLITPALLPVPSAVPPVPAVTEAPTLRPWPVKRDQSSAPVVRAKSALVIDLPTNRTLFEQDPDESRPIASLAKLMTAVVVLERTKLNELVTVPTERPGIEESQLGLQPGETLTVRDLLAGMLVASGNDAAHALAVHVSGSEAEFVKLMNERAEALGLAKTRFGTATGFDDGSSRSTARELSVIARMAIADPAIRAVAGQQELTVTSTQGTPYAVRTTDLLIGGYLPIAGLKTGTTDQAGPCLVSVLDSGERQVVAIVLDSPDRFQENKAMLDWTLRSYRWDRS